MDECMYAKHIESCEKRLNYLDDISLNHSKNLRIDFFEVEFHYAPRIGRQEFVALEWSIP